LGAELTTREWKIPNRHSDREHSEANMKSRLYKRVSYPAYDGNDLIDRSLISFRRAIPIRTRFRGLVSLSQILKVSLIVQAQGRRAVRSRSGVQARRPTFRTKIVYYLRSCRSCHVALRRSGHGDGARRTQGGVPYTHSR
jgi:hypothetical protein